MISTIERRLQSLQAEHASASSEEAKQILENKWEWEWRSASEYVIEQIRSNFPDGIPPDRILKSEFTKEEIHRISLDWPNKVGYFDESAWDICRLLSGKRWTEVLISEESGNLAMALTQMSEEAFQYYLPAFMVSCLTDDSMEKVAIPLSLLYLEFRISSWTDERREFFLGLGKEKSLVIAIFLKVLELFGWTDDPEPALVEYWDKFLLS